MEINVPLLKEICEIAGAPGFEKRVRDLVLDLVTPHVDEVKVDNIGNVIAIKKGKRNPDGKRVMVAAHMDEIGFIVTNIDDNGFLRFHTLGGFDPKTLTAQRVIVHGKKDIVGVMGSKPIHVMSPEERTKLPKTTDFFIDLGMPKSEVEKFITVGDPVTRDRELIEMGDCVNCKSIDNRVAVFILLETLKQLENPAYDVYATFTVQEEVGIRGANVAAHGINPDFGIALDTTIAFDVPGAQAHEKVTELGKGTAIKIMDALTICDYRMVEFMKQTAQKEEISWQPEILTAGGTDTAGVQRMGKQGAIAGAISIPTRHLHQVIEMSHKKDIFDSISLLKACLEQVDSYDWKH
ncbi:M42 family metallopeptidase [Algoriphagus machipongonensis]|uniref:M42 glutamyl aminopeptidase n=1 Tax=Algoriphagus machipongonensis TaxID=388413 RepID=A3HZT6_9BACT|nr:M42 family metallopeptidase [Algoriphagus machipongonensis]EAZ80772.1 M42 glutamyl aminopeptidase [Algoriphagus machipongonensis]